MKKLLLLSCILTGLIACKNESDNQPATIVHNDSIAPQKAVPAVSVINDTLISMQFAAGDKGTIASAGGVMNGDNHVTCAINIANTDSIIAEVVPEEEKGNVRFSQIIMPDGKMDGPFSNRLHYATPQNGTYKLIIFENMMAGDKWKGKFKVKVWVK